ncbi:MIP/aquaporin family protein [Hymenobacter jeollabukensis]|uniref:Aquaporin family protein n=1 Tax=Hymenobacter jeollabukensis TaxID=2025313 RepID=A0A5R8WTB9_9BACT|nr:aquaporin [Hymenobacter jeollabukensis]TLM95008.1 aquaporin family protein [Hymenobacter jeollabukensis]
MSFVTSLSTGLRRHWSHYLTEAAGVAAFLACTSVSSVLINHPDLPLRAWLGENELLRRCVLALVAGLVVVGITYIPWGQRSGAHINPAVTLAFWHLGSLRGADAFWYIVAQCAGAVAAGPLLSWALQRWYAHPDVNFNLTEPGPAGAGVAVLAEVVISGVLMWVLLYALHTERLRRFTGWLIGALIAAYVVVEAPLSGMSLNPARSLGAAVGAGRYEHLWIYWLAPIPAMWLAAVLFQRQHQGAPLACAVLAGCATKPAHGPYASEPPQFPDPEGNQ